MGVQSEDEAGVAVKDAPGAQQVSPVPRISIQAFCETPEVAAIVQAAIADRRHEQGARQAAYGRRAGGGGSLSRRSDAQSDRAESTHDRNALVGHLDELSQFLRRRHEGHCVREGQ